MSQSAQILKYLERGHTLTPLDALRRFGCFRLSGRIHELKQAGHSISREMVKRGGKRVARYSL